MLRLPSLLHPTPHCLLITSILRPGINYQHDHRPDGQSPDNSANSKWPLKPGVLVHVGKLNHVNISQLRQETSPFRTTSVTTLIRYKRNKSKFYARLQRLKDFFGISNGRDRVPSGITEGANGGKNFDFFCISLRYFIVLCFAWHDSRHL